jgi:hypothetical protein
MNEVSFNSSSASIHSKTHSPGTLGHLLARQSSRRRRRRCRRASSPYTRHWGRWWRRRHGVGVGVGVGVVSGTLENLYGVTVLFGGYSVVNVEGFCRINAVPGCSCGLTLFATSSRLHSHRLTPPLPQLRPRGTTPEKRLDCQFAIMAPNALSQPPRYICRLCSLSIRQPARHRQLWTAAAPVSRRNTLSRPTSRIQWRTASTTIVASKTQKKEKGFWENEWTIYSADNAHLVKKAQTFGDGVLTSKSIPSEEAVMKAMKVIEFASVQLTRPPSKQPITQSSEVSEAITPSPESEAGLLSLDSKPAHPMSISISIDLLSTLAYRIITHPPVFITAKILASYVTTQSALQRPDTFPEIFELYAAKPVPVPNSSPVKYKTPNPNAATQAVPFEVADKALTAAIESADLHLALAVIETSFGKKAFRKNKFVTKALPGVGTLALAPLAAIALSTQFPAISNVPDPNQFVAIASMSILAYVGAASTLGFVAITTRNDQMERVTWITGQPLRDRWLREEERAGLDRVAMAWGFKEVSRRGEEEGVDWEELKEWCGIRGMILDRVELMEGMQ